MQRLVIYLAAAACLVWLLVSMPASRAFVGFSAIAMISVSAIVIGPRLKQLIQRPALASAAAQGMIAEDHTDTNLPSEIPQPIEDSFSLVRGRGLLLMVFVGILIATYAVQFAIFRDPTDWPVSSALVVLGLCLSGTVYILFRISIAQEPSLVNRLEVATPAVFPIRWPWLLVSFILACLAAVRGTLRPEQAYFGEIMLVWILSMITFINAIAPVPTSAKTKPMDEKRFLKWEYLLLIGLFLAALLPRIINLNSQPYNVEFDEAIFANEGALMSVNHLLNTPFVQGAYSQARLYQLFMAFGMMLLGPTALAARLPTAITGAMLIPAAYLLGREIYNRNLGLLAALFLIGWAFAVQFSRLAIGETTDPLAITMCLYFILRGLRRGGVVDFALAGIMLGVAQMFWVSGLLGVPLLIAFLLFLSIRTPKALLRHWRNILVVVLGFIVTTIPLYYYYYVFQLPLSTRDGPTKVFVQKLIDSLNAGDFSYIIGQFRDSFLALILRADTGPFYGQTSNIMTPIGGPLVLLGALVSLFIIWKYPKWSLPLGWSLTVILGGGTFIADPPAYHRYAVGAVPFALVAAMGILTIAWVVCRVLQQPQLIGKLALGIGAVVCVANLAFYAYVYVPENKYMQKMADWRDNRVGREIADANAAGEQVALVGGWEMTVQDTELTKFLGFGVPYKVSDQPDDPNILKMVDPSKPFEYVIALQRRNVLELLEKTYPNGKVLEVSLDEDHSPLFYTFQQG